MSRRGLIIIAVVVVLLLASPFVIGMVNESALRNSLENYDRQPTVTARVTSYERGWLSSKARMEFGIDADYLSNFPDMAGNPAADMIADFTLPVIVEFEHGPILRSPGIGLGTTYIHAYIDPEWQYAQMAQNFLNIPYLIDFRGRGSLGLGFEYEGDVPPFEVTMPDASFEFSGIDFVGTFGGGRQTTDGSMASLAVQSMFFSAMVDALTFSSDAVRDGLDDIPLGTSTFKISRVAVNDPFGGPASSFSADGITLASSASENADDDFVDFAMVFGVDAMRVGNELAVRDSQFGLNFDHLDAESMRGLIRFMRSGDINANPEALQAELMPLVGGLLSGAPVVSLDPLTFTMPEGTATGTLKLTLDPGAFPAGMPMNELALMAAMGSASATLELTASKTLVQHLTEMYLQEQMAMINFGVAGEAPMPAEQLQAQAELQASMMVLGLSAQSIIIDSGDNWTTQITYGNGGITANGQPLPFGF